MSIGDTTLSNQSILHILHTHNFTSRTSFTSFSLLHTHLVSFTCKHHRHQNKTLDELKCTGQFSVFVSILDVQQIHCMHIYIDIWERGKSERRLRWKWIDLTCTAFKPFTHLFSNQSTKLCVWSGLWPEYGRLHTDIFQNIIFPFDFILMKPKRCNFALANDVLWEFGS